MTFHDHLDECAQCRDHPFELCDAGAALLEREAGAPGSGMISTTFTITLGGRRQWARPGVCAGCGCTERAACGGGCSWVDETRRLCSACFEAMAGHDRFEPRQRAQKLLFRIRCTQVGP